MRPCLPLSSEYTTARDTIVLLVARQFDALAAVAIKQAPREAAGGAGGRGRGGGATGCKKVVALFTIYAAAEEFFPT